MAAKGGGGGGEQQGSSDRSYDLLWLAGAIVITTLLLWHFEKVAITKAIFLARIAEIKIIFWCFYFFEKIATLLKLSISSAPLETLTTWYSFINQNYGGEVDFPTIIRLSSAIGKFIFIPISAILLILAATLFFGGSAGKFRNSFSLKTLRTSEQKIWEQITPIVKTNLNEKELDDEPWAVALDPMRFCKKHNLIREETKDGKPGVSLKYGAAYRVLSLQLGPKWTRPENLPMHLKALFAIFVARMDGGKKEAEELVNKIAKSALTAKPNFEGTEELFRKHSQCKQAIKITNLHGYITTVMASLLTAAREVGVLATSEFIWLKPLDRRMWYMLNGVGRQTAFAEVAGPFAHWLAEKKLGLPLIVPTVDEAVKGLELAMKDILYKPEEK